jgi:hypothetical protein
MAQFQSAWNQEFEVLREVQEDRLHTTASKLCLKQCIGDNEWFNAFLPQEGMCMDACAHKYAQANIIANINMQKFQSQEDANARAYKGRK